MIQYFIIIRLVFSSKILCKEGEASREVGEGEAEGGEDATAREETTSGKTEQWVDI